MTGHMTKIERNRASPARTWFGGMDGSDRALRVIARTTKILVKDVIISSSAGATESRVMPIRVRTAVDGLPSSPLISMLTLPPPGFAGSVGATGGVGSMGAAWPAEAFSHSSSTANRTAARPRTMSRLDRLRSAAATGRAERRSGQSGSERVNCGVRS